MDLSINYNWDAIQNIESKSYTCGYCGNPLASQKGYRGITAKTYGKIGHKSARIYICHFCTRPTLIDYGGAQFPGTAYGNDVTGIEEETVNNLYQEARRATSSSCFTAAVLCCRKLLMHIAVSKKADEGKSFAYYVEYLSNNHYVPPGAKVWVDHIREKGNEANHRINIMKPEDAKELLDFCEMLLKIIYEFPANVQKKYLTPNNDGDKNTNE